VRRYIAAWVLLTCAICGCGGKLETPEEFKSAVLQARDEAKAAQGNKDPKAAEKAAKRAEDALEKLRKQAGGEGETAARAKAVLAEADAATREARYFAELADEEHRLAEKLGGLKAKAYRAGRSTALSVLFKGLSLAADQAGKKGLAGLPKPVQEAANCAADFAGRAPLADGNPDWAGIAADMNARAAEPPAEVGFFLAVGFMLCGQAELSLYEIEALDPANPPELPGTPPGMDGAFFYLIRSSARRSCGWRHLAVRDLAAALKLGEPGKAGDGLDPQFRAVLHFTTALCLLQEKDLKGADLEIVEALRADPKSRLAVFLTGERLAADGEHEKAAESLESLAAGNPGAEDWLLKRVSARARELRDKRGAAEPLVCDSRFIGEVALHYAGEAARKSEPARRFKQSLDSAKGFCGQFLKHLPGGTQGEPEKPADSPGGAQ
jgi:hypothetical protein